VDSRVIGGRVATDVMRKASAMDAVDRLADDRLAVVFLSKCLLR
jgi:hypothetical protein